MFKNKLQGLFLLDWSVSEGIIVRICVHGMPARSCAFPQFRSQEHLICLFDSSCSGMLVLVVC